eukprot:m.208684 g.208684  ORF g.208684 m.208684 type:complete len:1399 (-) comp17801_c0_seq1:205-4401(-)
MSENTDGSAAAAAATEAAPTTLSPLSIADYFVVLGLDSNGDLVPEALNEGDAQAKSSIRQAFRAHVLQHFPDSCLWNPLFDREGVISLCFPRGLRFKREVDDRRIRFHSFVITREDGSRLYGASLIFFEQVKDSKILVALQMLEVMDQRMSELSPNKVDHKSAQLATGEPPIDWQREKIYAPKSVCLLSQLPAVACFEHYLRQLFLLSRQDPLPLPLECYITNLLFETPMPPPGMSLKFHCTQPIVLHRPSEDSLPMFEYSMRRLFALLPPRTLMMLFNCIIMEKQIVIRSKEYDLLVLVAECVTTLLYPFAWPHVYVPILPSALLRFLEAPVPFIMGLQSDVPVDLGDPHSRDGDGARSLCILEIDKGIMSIPENVASFPGEKALIEKLDALVQSQNAQAGCTTAMAMVNAKALTALLSGSTLPPTPNNPGTESDYQFSKAVRELFLNAWTDIFSEYETYIIMPDDPASYLDGTSADDDVVFDTLAFLSDQPRQSASFVQDFLQTQMFHAFIDRKVRDILSNSDRVTCFDRVVLSRREMEMNQSKLEELSASQSSPTNLLSDTFQIMSITPPDTTGSEGSLIVDYEAVLPHPVMIVDTHPGLSLGQKPNLPEMPEHTEDDPPTGGSESSPMARRASATIGSFSVPPKHGVRRPGATNESSATAAAKAATAAAAAVSAAVEESFSILLEDAPMPEDSSSSEADAGSAAAAASAPVAAEATKSKLAVPGRAPGLGHKRTRSLPFTRMEDLRSLEESMTGRRLFGELSNKYFPRDLPFAPWPAARDKIQRSYTISKGEMARRKRLLGRHISRVVRNEPTTPREDDKYLPSLNECATKIKKMVVVMMGANSSSKLAQAQAGGFENRMVASFCDLLERMWKHGQLNTECKSAMWAHLKKALDCKDLFTSEVLNDIQAVSDMSFLRTDVGRARAWIRLCMEKKTLSKHLHDLLKSEEFLRGLYHSHAFLLQEENREQLTHHLMSLTTVDFSSFSSNYAPATVAYDICIYTAKGFRAGTSANVIITLVGEHGCTKPIYRPRGPSFASGGEHRFTIEEQNLGPLKSVIIAHDNSGMTPGWMVDKVTVVNKLTGIQYYFPCNQRLDSNTSQICVASQTRAKEEEVCKDVPEHAVFDVHADLQAAHDKLSENFAAAINSIVKYFYPPSNTQTLDGQAVLLLGPHRLLPSHRAEAKTKAVLGEDDDPVTEEAAEAGLCGTITNIFMFGFKTKSRMFSGNRHIWDLFDRAHNNMKNSELSSDPEGLFYTTVEKANAMNIHKTARFEWCMCAGATHHVLHVWVQMLAQVAVASHWYDQTSIFRNAERVSFVTELLRYLVEFPIRLQDHLVYVPAKDKDMLGLWRVDPVPHPQVQPPGHHPHSHSGPSPVRGRPSKTTDTLHRDAHHAATH